jgi:predicted HAD superfamily phosphohydrolase YqeG
MIRFRKINVGEGIVEADSAYVAQELLAWLEELRQAQIASQKVVTLPQAE